MSAFLESASVSIANGSSTVAVTGATDCGQVVSGTAVIIDGILVEGASGTAPDGTGASSITLAKPWAFATKSAVRMIAFNTFEGMVGAIARARAAALNSAEVLTAFDEVLTATTPTVTIEINGVPLTVTPYGYLSAQSTALIAELEAATGALTGLQEDIDALTADVAAQQGIVDANLTASNSAASTATSAATTATSAATTATGAASTATAAATAAEDAADLAVPAATTATNAATLAQDWASKAENSVVSSGKYSALHYAAKAEFWAGQAAGAAAGALVYVGQYNASSNTFPSSPSSGYVYEISTQGTLSGFENISGSQTVRVGDHIAKTATGWVLWFGYQTTLPTARGGTGRTDGKVTELATSRNFSITGKATASAVGFTGAGNVVLNVTALSVTQAEVANLTTDLANINAAVARARLFGLIGMTR